MVNIFEYTDFRNYLNDYFMEKKKLSNYFSHRFLCQKLGLKSSNYMLLVMRGKRNISSEICFKLSTIFKHTQQQAAYFLNMVFFTQSKNFREKDLYWEKMVELRQKTMFRRIPEYQYEYYNNWYNITVRELITVMDKPIDYTVLARLIIPPITAVQARNSVKLLLKLGMIQETESGYSQTDQVLKTDETIKSLAVFNYHLKMSTLATHALENYKREERNFSSCTLNLSQDGYRKTVEYLNEFRDKLMTICKKNANPERIYHINLQLFPVSINNIKKENRK
jgi:uncharacterized protein (TIGR02147 family)